VFRRIKPLANTLVPDLLLGRCASPNTAYMTTSDESLHQSGQPARGPSPARLWAVSFAAALVAGLAAWIIGEQSLHLFTPAREWRTGKVDAVSRLKPTVATLRAADTKNAALGFSILGALLGLALGGAGGLARRSSRQALLAGLAGLVLGGALVPAVTLAALPLYYRVKDLDRSQDDLVLALGTHVGIWSMIGIGGGMAFGFGLGGRRQLVSALCGGLVGAMLGTVVFEFLGAVAFPIDAYAAEPVSNTPGSRLAARLLVAIGTSCGAVVGALMARRPASDVLGRS
jgi:hypothetical protein